MAKDVIITPLDGDIQFENSTGTEAGKIEQSGDDLVLSNAVGDILIGDGTADVYIGDGAANVDIVFEQNGSIRGEAGSSVGITLGSSDTNIIISGSTFNIDPDATFDGDVTANSLIKSGGASTEFLKADGSVDTSTYLTTLPTHNHDGRYLRTHTRYQDDLDTITTSGVYIWDVSEADDEPTGASDGLLTIKYWDSTSWATANFQDFHANKLYIKSKQSGTWQTDWAQVWTTDQLTTTNKTNYDTAHTYSQVGHLPLAGGTLTGNLSIDIADNGSAPAMTNTLKLKGFEGRGVGIKIQDSINSATSPSNREWFIGSGYNNSGFNIGYASDGVQSSYNAQSFFNIATTGHATFAGNIVMAANATVDGVDISGLPTSFAPTNAEQNVQSDWNATSGDALILNKPTIPTDHGDHDGLYLPIGGGTVTGDLTVNGKITQAGVVDREEWGRTYAASNTTIATLVTSDGSALPTGGGYRMTGHISSTGTEQVSVAVFWNENGTWYCNNTFAGGTSSNHIEFLISGGVPKIKTWHANNYNINVTHERLSLNEGTGTDNLRGYFGADSFLKWTESTNALVVPGSITGTSLDINGNADISGNLSGVDTLTATTLSVTNYGLASGDIPNNAADTTGNAATVTTNADLTGHITSVGNATSLGSFTTAQLNAAISDGAINSQTLPTDFISAANGGTFSGALKITDALNSGSPILDLHNSTNGEGTDIRFTDVTAGTTQFGNITYRHQDSKSYGSAAGFTIGSSEASTTILADGKLMYNEGIYSKPATGTGAGTRKDSNWDSAYDHSQDAHAPANAEQNVQSDWNATSGDALILNKPTILTSETNSFLGDGGGANTHPGTSRLIYSGQIGAGAAVLGMPTVNNANAFINLNKHSGEYNSQLGFSSNGHIYYRNFSNTAINSTQTWHKVYTENVFANNSANWNTAYGWGDHADAGYIDSDSNYLKSNAADTFTGQLSVGSTNTRRAGIYGIYDSNKIGHIWSMGTGYMIPSDGSDFGNLYGLAYKHTNNSTGGTMAGGHQAVWATNGTPRAALGESGIWTSGNVTHSGLTMTDGTDIDQIKSYTKSLTLTTSWIDTGVNGNELATGTYIVQVTVDNHDANGLQYDEMYSGTMSWYASNSNSTNHDEIVLHAAGHARNNVSIYLRVLRTVSADTNDLKLQISNNRNATATASNYIFKFRRMI